MSIIWMLIVVTELRKNLKCLFLLIFIMNTFYLNNEFFKISLSPVRNNSLQVWPEKLQKYSGGGIGHIGRGESPLGGSLKVVLLWARCIDLCQSLNCMSPDEIRTLRVVRNLQQFAIAVAHKPIISGLTVCISLLSFISLVIHFYFILRKVCNTLEINFLKVFHHWILL